MIESSVFTRRSFITLREAGCRTCNDLTPSGDVAVHKIIQFKVCFSSSFMRPSSPLCLTHPQPTTAHSRLYKQVTLWCRLQESPQSRTAILEAAMATGHWVDRKKDGIKQGWYSDTPQSQTDSSRNFSSSPRGRTVRFSLLRWAKTTPVERHTLI